VRILIVYPEISVFGGAELVITHLCNHLVVKGHNPTLLTTGIIPEVRDRIRETEVILCPAKKPGMNVFEYSYLLWKHVRNIALEYDLINVHNFPAEMSAFRCPRPVIWLCNEPEYFLTKDRISTMKGKLVWHVLMPLEKYVVRRHIEEIVVSDGYNERRVRGIYDRTSTIIRYGIDAEFFNQKEPESKTRLGWQQNFLVLHVGMITPFKNQLRSLSVLDELRQKIQNILLVFAGSWEKEYKEDLDRVIAQKKLSDFVHFTGHVDREKLRLMYSACDVLLHPIKPQGGWLAPFEAMCADKPVIVSKELTASSIIETHKIGVVTDDYVSTIMDVYQNPDVYQAMGIKARDWVLDNLSWHSFCDKFLEVFQAVATKHQ